jgi:hypothetical protein
VDQSALTTKAVEETMQRIAAKGPEYEALAKLSKEVIEQIVWEVVPDLAEVIIKENLQRLTQDKSS